MGALVALVLAVAAAAPPLPPVATRLYRVLWARQLVPRTLLEYRPSEPGGPAVDPTTGMVVAGTRDGWVHAFLPDGSLLWEFKAGAGFQAAPLITSDTVYAASLDGFLYARDKATGKERWQYDAKEELGTQPVVAGGLVYVATMQDTVLALDARTGEWKWHHRRETSSGFTIRGVAAPIVSGGVVYAGFSDGTVAALDARTGSPRWERSIAPKSDFMDVDGLAMEEGRLYAAAYSGLVVALNPANGNSIWEAKAPLASRVVAGRGWVVALTADKELALQGTNGKELWSAPLSGTPAGIPVALAGQGLLLVPNTKGLLFVDGRSGRVLRNFTRGRGITASPAVAGTRMYVLTNGGELVAAEILD